MTPRPVDVLVAALFLFALLCAPLWASWIATAARVTM